MTARQLHRVEPARPRQADTIPGDPAPWMADAPCRDADPDLFFSDNPADIGEAKRICGGCPSRVECRQYADDNSIEFGVWGGMSRDERLKRRCVTCKETMLLGEFGAHSGYLDGLNVRCRECVRDAGKQCETNLPDRETSTALLRAAGERRRAERDARVREYGRLRDECGMTRRQAAAALEVTERTAERYERDLAQQAEVAA